MAQAKRRSLLLLWAWAALASVVTLSLALVIWRNDVGHYKSILQASSSRPSRVMLGAPQPQDVPILGTHCCTTEYGQDTSAFAATGASYADGKGKGKGNKADSLEAQLFQQAVAEAGGNDSSTLASTQVSGGVYLVATKERTEGDLEGMLARLDTHFIRLHNYPVVVFLAAYTLSEEAQQRLRAAAPSTNLDFRPLLSLVQQRTGDEAAYARSLWEFEVAEAPRVLAQDYEWVLRLSEDTLLNVDVLLDPFMALQATERKLGYIVTHRAVEEESLWAFGRSFFLQHSVSKETSALHLTWNVPKAMDGRWVAFHRSVFTSELYQALVVGLAASSLTQPQPTGASAPVPPPAKLALANARGPTLPPFVLLDEAHGPLSLPAHRRFLNATAATPGGRLPSSSAVLTLGSLLTLTQDQFMQYRGLNFQRPPQRGGLQGLTPEEVAGITRSSWRDIQITATEADDLQPLFAVRNEGWLGADVATSFRFPPLRPRGAEEDDLLRLERKKYMWLFGDTLLGYANPDRRLAGAFFLHNSIAFLPGFNRSDPAASPPQAEDVTFAWNISRGGCPISVFVRGDPQDDECVHTQEYLWPISGMGVSYLEDRVGNGTAGAAASTDGEQKEEVSKVVVLAVRWAYVKSMSASVDLFDDNVFNFRILGTTVLVVDNPHDDPTLWRYRQRDIPGTDENLNWYSAMMHSTRGQELATGPDELIYLFGVNNTEAAGTPPQQWQYETLSRIPVKSLVDLSFRDMEVWAMTKYRSGNRTARSNTTWASYPGFLKRKMKAAPLVFPVFSETSVRYSEVLGAYYGVVVDWLASQVVLYVTEELTDAWEPVVVYKIPPPFDDPAVYMTYAGKTHPELARDNEIVLTFMTNAPGDLEPLFESGAKDVYVPRFLRLTLDRPTPPAVTAPAAGITMPAP